MNSRVLVYELNEFNRDFLEEMSNQLDLQHLKTIFSMRETTCSTADSYDSDWLEPWVQWVSVHTGSPSDLHQVKHLGDVPDLRFPQIWEVLSGEDISSGVWGVLNGSKGDAPNCKFFLPDPWTFSEQAFPPRYNHLLELPRYMAKNRLNIRLTKLIPKAGRFLLCFLSSPPVLLAAITESPRFVRMALKNRGKDFVGFCFAEYLLGLLFLEQWKHERPQLGILFQNSLAHLQHYYWRSQNSQHLPEISYGLYFINKIFGMILAELDSNDHLIVINALSQVNTNQEPEWVSYRPIDHGSFFQAVDLKYQSVEALMSYDALIFFESITDCQLAYQALREAKVGDNDLFLVEQYDQEPLKLFYRFQFTDPVEADEVCEVNDVKFPFSLHFQKIVTRRGKHVQSSSMFSNREGAPKRMKNHEIYNYILHLFDQSLEGSQSTGASRTA